VNLANLANLANLEGLANSDEENLGENIVATSIHTLHSENIRESKLFFHRAIKEEPRDIIKMIFVGPPKPFMDWRE